MTALENVKILVNGSESPSFSHEDSAMGRVVAQHDGSDTEVASVSIVVRHGPQHNISAPLKLNLTVEPVADTLLTLHTSPVSLSTVRSLAVFFLPSFLHSFQDTRRMLTCSALWHAGPNHDRREE